MKLRFSIALLVALAPVFAQAKPVSGGGHMRPQLFHDRSPKPHVREGHARKVQEPKAKSQPPPTAAQPDQE